MTEDRRAVVDASAACAWFFEDEADAAGDAMLDRVRTGGAVVPMLWHTEVANALRQGERRGRLAEGKAEALLAALDALPIETDQAEPPPLRLRVLALARLHGLTAYDATYLDLAMRRGLPLATRDADLRRAAGAAGVALLDA